MPTESHLQNEWKYYIIRKMEIPCMRKNPDELKTTIEIDPVTGEYYTIIPEWIMNDQGWYEGTNLQFNIDADDIILSEADE